MMDWLLADRLDKLAFFDTNVLLGAKYVNILLISLLVEAIDC